MRHLHFSAIVNIAVICVLLSKSRHQERGCGDNVIALLQVHHVEDNLSRAARRVDGQLPMLLQRRLVEEAEP